jgi:hypothetical protein
MSEKSEQPGWMVNKKYGHVSDITWHQLPDDDDHIYVNHFKKIRGLTAAPKKIAKNPSEPHENEEAWVFTDETTMNDWLRDDAALLSRKLQNYLEKLSSIDSRANFMISSIWPDNFILGYVPKDYRDYSRVYLSARKICEYSVDSVVKYTEKQLGMPLCEFNRVWNKMEYAQYNNELSIVLAISSQEQIDYFNKHSPNESVVVDKIAFVMKAMCPELKYNLTVRRTPRYLFGDDKHLVSLATDFDTEFYKVLGNNIKTKLSNAVRRPLLHSANISAYLVGRDMLGKVPSHVLQRSIILPYTYASAKCYTVYAPININVWARPDNTIIVDTNLATGSAELTRFNNTLSSSNILDQLLEMS